MSTEQSTERQPSTADITQQVTTPTPATKPKTEKNPNRVAAGKRTTERTRLAREAQKKALAEANIIIEKNKAHKAAAKAAAKLLPTAEEPEQHNTTTMPAEPSSGRSSFSLCVADAGVVVAGAGVAVTVVTYLFKPEKVKSFCGWTTMGPQKQQVQQVQENLVYQRS